jgi:hypothetical protein
MDTWKLCLLLWYSKMKGMAQRLLQMQNMQHSIKPQYLQRLRKGDILQGLLWRQIASIWKKQKRIRTNAFKLSILFYFTIF